MIEWIDGKATMAAQATSAEAGSIALIGPRPAGRSEPIVDGPQAFLALLPADPYVLRAHYHRVDQFQLFVGGSATVANHPVRQWHVHFSDRMQPYGPIRPAGGGLAFLTLRPSTGGGVFYMPEAQPLLADGLSTLPEPVATRRNLTFDLNSVSSGVLAEEADGMRVAVVAASPGESTEPLAIAGAGAYVVVLEGSLRDSESERGPGSLAWVDAGTVAGPLTAGPLGLKAAILQYPAKPWLPGAELSPALTVAG